ncbi:trigger factor [Paraferrimonas sp. SM1919]|uniref:trigger factor n=1 Tax=Paraferrimonas sp. SM1919 TaxID=2662263 RepID=UPI0013D6DAEF|nr:trigger factor [Paraferrimonas sp. SM1919]
MQVSVETTQGLERRLTITIEAKQIEDMVAAKLKSEAKRVRIDGFRPGKVPLSVVNKRFGAAIRQEVMGEAMQRSFFEAVVAEKINPAGMPTFAPTQSEGEDFVFTATVEVYPEVELANLDAIEVEKPVCTIKAEDIDSMVDTLRKQHAKFEAVEREAKDGDKVKIDFVGSIDGEEFDGGKGEGFDLEIGSGRMIPGFESGIAGHKAGEQFDIEVTFPEEYHAENLKGKAATFAITLTEVTEAVLPELNDEFVALFGITEGGVDALKAEIEKNMQRELDQALKANIKTQTLDGLVAKNELEVPAALVEQEVNVLRQQAVQRMGGAQNKNMPELPAELFTEQAARRVKVGLLLGEVIKSNELEASDEKVEELIASMSSAYEDPAEVIAHYKGNQELMQQMKNVALEEQAVEKLLETAKVTEKEVAFEEFMNQAGQR